jgi:hypothetical protein
MYTQESILSSCQLPNMSLAQLPAEEVASETYEQSFLEQLETKTARAMKKYDQSKDLLAFSNRVEKITGLFLMAAKYKTHSNGSSHISLTTQVGEKLEALRTAFNTAMDNKEKDAKEAFAKNDYGKALLGFNELLTVVAKQSARYFLLEGCTLAAFMHEGKVSDAITLYVRLASEKIPEALGSWFEQQKATLTTYLQQTSTGNEQELQACSASIQQQSKTFEGLFSSFQDFDQCKSQLQTIQKTLQTTQETLKKCQKLASELQKHYQQLGMQYKTEYTTVNISCTQCKAVVDAALLMVSDMSMAIDAREQSTILCQWLSKNVAAYQNKPSEFHLWVLSRLGKLYSTGLLLQTDLDEPVKILRANVATLFVHFQKLPADVHLHFGSYGIDTSLLLLATISQYFEQNHCSVKAITSLHSSSWGVGMVTSLLSALSFTSSRNSAQALPKIELNGVAQDQLSHAKNIDSILHGLISCFQKQGINAIQSYSPEETVSLFEVANSLLQMPKNISALLLRNLNTLKFQGSLNAIQWLRLTQATQTSLPYAKLQELFKNLSKKEFLEWVSLYDPQNIQVDPQKHHLLFSSLYPRAVQLLNQCDAEEIKQAFEFFVDLYDALVAKHRRSFDMKLITFGWRCVTCAPELASDSDFQISQHISYFNGQEHDLAIEHPSKNWLELQIYPHITELVVYDLLPSTAFAHYSNCTRVTHLTVHAQDSSNEGGSWDKLKQFQHLTHLTIQGGSVDISQLNDVPLKSLTLRDCQGQIDFSQCRALCGTLEHLSLSNVLLVKDSLSWVVSSTCLKHLAIENCNMPIGKLADSAHPHARPALEILTLKGLLSAEVDADLYASLPDLITTQTTIVSITCQSQVYNGCILDLLKGASLVTELALQWKQDENSTLLASFPHLKRVRFFVTSYEEFAQVGEQDYSACQALEHCECVDINSGMVTTMPLN